MIQRVEELKHRLTQKPDDPSLFYKLGKAYIEAEEFGESSRALRKAVALAPGEIKYHLLLARVYAKQHRYVPAGKQYKQVLSLDPSNLKAHMNLGLVLEFHLGNPSRALAHYKKYVDNGGDDPRVLKRLKLLTEETQSDKAPSGPKHKMKADAAETSGEDAKEDF